MKLLVKGRVPSSIGACPGAQLGVGVVDDDVGVLAREELGVPQLPAPRHSDLEELALDRHGRAAREEGGLNRRRRRRRRRRRLAVAGRDESDFCCLRTKGWAVRDVIQD